MKKTLVVTSNPVPDETFAAAMGITPEREAAIDELMDKYHAETSTYPDAIAALSKNINTANELAYASFHLGAFAESQRTKHDLLSKLLE